MRNGNVADRARRLVGLTVRGMIRRTSDRRNRGQKGAASSIWRRSSRVRPEGPALPARQGRRGRHASRRRPDTAGAAASPETAPQTVHATRQTNTTRAARRRLSRRRAEPRAPSGAHQARERARVAAVGKHVAFERARRHVQVIGKHALHHRADVERRLQIARLYSARGDRPGQSAITRPPCTAPPSRNAAAPVP